MTTMKQNRYGGQRGRRMAASALSLIFSLAVGAAAHAQDAFNLDALIDAAKKEKPITVYAVTGKIVDTAQAFTAKYGVQASGKKVNEATQVELMIREHRAGNVVGDVSVATDVASAMGELLPQGIATSWSPPDMEGDIPQKLRDPLWSSRTHMCGPTIPRNTAHARSPTSGS